MRQAGVVLHRYVGLILAVFLCIAGTTGALIAWDHELDALLFPELYHADGASGVDPARALELADRLESADPRLAVSYLPLRVEPGHTLLMSVEPRIDPAIEAPFELGFNQVAVHPDTGEVQARREWGALSLHRENLMPFLYRLHYSLHLPIGWGRELGVLLMGIVAIVWLLDSGVALWISFPNRKTWRRSFAFRWKEGGHRVTFDLHRSGGVWVFPLLVVMATTAIAMNLEQEVMRPLVSAVSDVTDGPFELREPRALDASMRPTRTRSEVLAAGQQRAQALDIEDPVGGLFYSALYDVYGVGFFLPGREHGDVGFGNPWLYYDGTTGEAAGAELPGRGTAGDLFLQAQFPLHSGRILGWVGRAVVSLLGALIAVVSVTGVLIWARKRRARELRGREKRGEIDLGSPVRSTHLRTTLR